MLRALCLALALAACTAPPRATITPTPSPTREAGTYAVTALLDLSGPRGPHGDAQRDAMVRWTDAQRGTPRVKLRVVDVAGSDAKLLLELKRAADAADTDAFVVGVPATVDDALVAAIALVKRPVLFTLPIAAPSGDGARWIFGLAPTPDAIARSLLAALPARGTPAVVVTSGTLAAGREELALTAAFQADGRPMPFILSAAAEQRDAFAPRLRPFLSGGTALFFTGPAVSYLEPQRLIPALETPAPLLLLSYLSDPADLSRLGDAAATARWPGLRGAIGTGFATHAATATDALALLAAKADVAGDPELTRTRLEGGTFAGIATTYAFSPSRHTGVDPREIALLAYENGRVVAARASAVPAK